jgi:hypothetical protein
MGNESSNEQRKTVKQTWGIDYWLCVQMETDPKKIEVPLEMQTSHTFDGEMSNCDGNRVEEIEGAIGTRQQTFTPYVYFFLKYSSDIFFV